MNIFFKNGFYVDDGLTAIPKGAVELSPEDYERLLTLQAKGKLIYTNAEGYPVIADPRPSAYHELVNGEWTIRKENAAILLNEKKTQVLNTLADKADSLIGQILAGYPQTEIDSFYRQEKEALALKNNPEAQTPMLSQIATARGVALNILAEKVLEKAEQFSALAGGIIGQRQGFEDRLNALETDEQLTVLLQEIDQWQLSII